MFDLNFETYFAS